MQGYSLNLANRTICETNIMKVNHAVILYLTNADNYMTMVMMQIKVVMKIRVTLVWEI